MDNSTAKNNDLEEGAPEPVPESKCYRVIKSPIFALIAAFLILIPATIVLGWNEKRAVCDQYMVTQAKDVAERVFCNADDMVVGDLYYFTCKITNESLSVSQVTAPDGLAQYGEFAAGLGSVVTTGLKMVSEMVQCVEKVNVTKNEDGIIESTTYSYALEFSDTLQSSTYAMPDSPELLAGCGTTTNNPRIWPEVLPYSRTLYSRSVNAGVFTLDKEFVDDIPLTRPLVLDSVPSGWVPSGDGYEKYIADSVSATGIGSMRVTFYGNDWTNNVVTAIGRNLGNLPCPTGDAPCQSTWIGTWAPQDCWPCAFYTIGRLVMGEVSHDDLFGVLESSGQTSMMIVRFVGWVSFWVAFFFLAGPLKLVQDILPCIGRCFGDNIMGIACCVAIVPASACALVVMSLMWVMMRPYVGVPMFALGFFGLVFVACFKVHAKITKFLRPVKESKLPVPMEMSEVFGRDHTGDEGRVYP